MPLYFPEGTSFYQVLPISIPKFRLQLPHKTTQVRSLPLTIFEWVLWTRDTVKQQKEIFGDEPMLWYKVEAWAIFQPATLKQQYNHNPLGVGKIAAKCGWKKSVSLPWSYIKNLPLVFVSFFVFCWSCFCDSTLIQGHVLLPGPLQQVRQFLCLLKSKYSKLSL